MTPEDPKKPSTARDTSGESPRVAEDCCSVMTILLDRSAFSDRGKSKEPVTTEADGGLEIILSAAPGHELASEIIQGTNEKKFIIHSRPKPTPGKPDKPKEPGYKA